MVGVVLVAEPIGGIGGVGRRHQELDARAGVGHKPVGCVGAGATIGGGCGNAVEHAARGADIRRIGSQLNHAAEAGQNGFGRELVLVEERAGIAPVKVEALVAVGRHMVHVDEEIRLLGAAEKTEAAGVEGAIVELGIPGAIGDGAANIEFIGERLGEQMYGAAKGGWSNSGGRSGAAVEVHSADPLRGKKSP